MTDRLKEGQHSIHSDPMLGTLAEGAAAVRAVRDRERMQCYEQDRNNDRERERETGRAHFRLCCAKHIY